MDLFNELISGLQLIDVPLKNRSYTWCSKRPKPVFSRLDRCFISPKWNAFFPIITLHAQEMMISDHVPLVLSCKHRLHTKRQPKMELFWLRHSEMHQVVNKLWGQQPTLADTHASFNHKTASLQVVMGRWHRDRFAKMEEQLTVL